LAGRPIVAGAYRHLQQVPY